MDTAPAVCRGPCAHRAPAPIARHRAHTAADEEACWPRVCLSPRRPVMRNGSVLCAVSAIVHGHAAVAAPPTKRRDEPKREQNTHACTHTAYPEPCARALEIWPSHGGSVASRGRAGRLPAQPARPLCLRGRSGTPAHSPGPSARGHSRWGDGLGGSGLAGRPAAGSGERRPGRTLNARAPVPHAGHCLSLTRPLLVAAATAADWHQGAGSWAGARRACTLQSGRASGRALLWVL